ncbi:MAG TPA: prolyl aminopeptidase [Caulobacteraceae bacterium]
MRRELFPQIEPFDSGHLRLDDLHTMYFEQSGNADGTPALFLHGGPGSGSHPDHRRLFDPGAYRIVVYDQRGAGRSTPHGETRRNTAALLIDDIERLREHLRIDRWLLLGGSWGSTLALAYAQAHPSRCLGLILRGIFLARPQEIDWFMRGMGTIFPEAWRAFAAHIPVDQRHDLLGAYQRRLSDADPAVHGPAARAWSLYEGSCATLRPDTEALAVFRDDAVALGMGRIEAHYFVNETYFEAHPLLGGIDAIRDIPATIIQGRYDIVCPIVTADELARAWPQARYVIVPEAGHLEREPGIRAAKLAATEAFKNRLAF